MSAQKTISTAHHVYVLRCDILCCAHKYERIDSSTRRRLLAWLDMVTGCRELYCRALKKPFVTVKLIPIADAKGAVIKHIGTQF